MSKNYMEKVGVLLESFPEPPELPEAEFNAWLLEQILSRKQELFEITDALEKIPMFIDSKTKYDAFLEGVRNAKNSSADRIVLSMMHFLNKINTAPTTLRIIAKKANDFSRWMNSQHEQIIQLTRV